MMTDLSQTIDRIKAAREAGQVNRAHVVPYIGSYNNAQHSYGVATLIYLLWPNKTHLLPHALFHDVPERWTGDVPAQVLRTNPALRQMYVQMELCITRAAQFPFEHTLPPEDWWILKSADRIELWLWTYEQERMGNKEIMGIRAALEKVFEDTWNDMPVEAQNLIQHVTHRGWTRLPELLDKEVFEK